MSLLRAYCQERGPPYEETGMLVIAVRPDKLGRMDNLYERARNNHVSEPRPDRPIRSTKPCAS